jgi:hypothetical protein
VGPTDDVLRQSTVACLLERVLSVRGYAATSFGICVRAGPPAVFVLCRCFINSHWSGIFQCSPRWAALCPLLLIARTAPSPLFSTHAHPLLCGVRVSPVFWRVPLRERLPQAEITRVRAAAEAAKVRGLTRFSPCSLEGITVSCHTRCDGAILALAYAW